MGGVGSRYGDLIRVICAKLPILLKVGQELDCRPYVNSLTESMCGQDMQSLVQRECAVCMWPTVTDFYNS